MSYLIREPKKTDLNFIMNSFLRSIKRESSLGRATLAQIYFPNMQKVLDRILARSSVLIACSEEIEDCILGYLIFEKELIHYCYVVPGCQEQGIAKDLVKQGLGVLPQYIFTINTDYSKKIAKTHKHLIYNPFPLFNKEIQ